MGNRQDVEKYGGHKASVPSQSIHSQSDYSHPFVGHHQQYPTHSILIRKANPAAQPPVHDPLEGNTTSTQLARSVIYGYCRESQHILQYIIPLSIIELLFEFYYISKKLICLVEGSDIHGNSLNACYLSDVDNSSNWKVNLFDMNQPHKPITRNDYKWTMESAAMCYQENVQRCLPSDIIQRVQSLYQSDSFTMNAKHRQYNAIFRCGGIKNDGDNSNYSNCMIIADEEFKGWNWKLPSLPHYPQGHELVFSDKYGLLCIGGKDDEENVIQNIYQLLLNEEQISLCNRYVNGGSVQSVFDTNDLKQWKWKQIAKLKLAVHDASSVLVENHHKEQLLFVITGKAPANFTENRVQILNMSKLEPCKFAKGRTKIPRSDGGVCYDSCTQRIYLCGGRDGHQQDTSARVHEYLEIERDCWYTDGIPGMKIGYKPLVWTEGSDLLYTAGFLHNSFSMQWIDLRCHNNTQWNLQRNVDIHNKTLLSHVPYPKATCRLLM